MCFSAEASFVAGAGLSVAGALTLRAAPARSDLLLASVPSLFGLQQISEGMVWTELLAGKPEAAQLYAYAFTALSHILWPILLPLAVLLGETNPFRRSLQSSLLCVGCISGIYIGLCLYHFGLTVHIVNGHLGYYTTYPFLQETFTLYVMASATPCLSSHRYITLFGLLLLLSLVLSLQFFALTFISVWCYFAAVLSAVICLHFLELIRNRSALPCVSLEETAA